MKRALLALGLVLALSASASAALVTQGARLDYKGQLRHLGNGGEFRFEHYTGTTGNWAIQDDFITFCGQLGEFISGQTYYVTWVTDSTNSPIPPSGAQYSLHDFGEWVYWGYKSTLEKGNVVPDRESNTTNPIGTLEIKHDNKGGLIQWAIWTDMGYSAADISNKGGIAGNPDLALYTTWQTQYALDNVAGGNWYEWKRTHLNEDPTKIAWLSTVYSDIGKEIGPAQDQLIFSPGQTGIVPEPASLAIWALAGGLGAMGVALKRRRGRWSNENRQAITELVTRRTRQG